MLEAGTIINERYRVLGLLGEGGMGSVFEGEHTGVGRKVAIKVLHSTYTKNEEIVGRFEREARAAAAIGHDNIIDVIDFGRHGEAPYMIMEFLKGESLGARLEREGRLTVESASHIMNQVLSALAAAHNVGIVHRDLKPDNVYLIQKGNVTDYVKLLDFGISKFKSEQGGDSKGLTQTGAMMGTPYYMAPEQALAKRDIDHRADLYSAGVMLYQMVTGTLPFHAESQAELLMAIVYQPFGITSPRQHVPDLHPEFENIILKAMSKERENRFSSAMEFAQALAPWAGMAPMPSADSSGMMRGANPSGQSVTPFQWQKSTGMSAIPGANATGTAIPVAVPTPTAKKGKGPLIAVAAAVVVLGVVGGVVLLRPKPAPATPPVAVAPPSPTRPTAAGPGAPGALPAGTTGGAPGAALVAAQTPGGAPTAPAGGGTTAAPVPTAPVAPALSPTLVIDLEGVPTNAVITVDGATVPTPHLTLARGSSHAVHVTAPGLLPWDRTIIADRERTYEVAMQVEAPAVQPPPPTQVASAPQPAVIRPRNNPRPSLGVVNPIMPSAPQIPSRPVRPSGPLGIDPNSY